MRIALKAGMGLRLGMVFLAVLGFAVVANRLAVHRVSTVHTTEIQTIAPTTPVAAPPAVSNEVQPRLPHGAELGMAVGRFGGAVMRRMADASSQADAQLHSARELLNKTAAVLDQPDADALDPKTVQNLKTHLRIQRDQAQELVQVADGRRVLVAQYRERFEALDRRMKQALDGAWRMLGRVIARQSLIELSQRLDDVRWQLSSFVVTGSYTAATVKAMRDSEAALLQALQQNERGLVRAQGQQWVDLMRSDMNGLAAIRGALLEHDERRRRGLERFSGANAAALDVVQTLVQEPVEEVAPAAVPAVAPAVKNAMFDAPSPTTTTESRDEQSGVLALASVALLVLLSIAGVWIVRNHNLLESKVGQRTRELQELAEKDSLTALPNRRQLFVLLDAALSEAQRKGRRVGVFFLDLDNFKHINDGMGHAYGDQVLKEVGKRLNAVVKGQGFAARLGGDEFTVVIPDAASHEQIYELGERLVRAFQQPLNLGYRDLTLSVSVGASVYPEHESDSAALLQAADVALFRAKALGRNQLAVFTRGLLEAAASKFATEQGLRRALQKGEFELVFQPEIQVETLEVSLVEALLRWRLPDGRYVSPGDFLPVAEESGLIMDISDWVLRSAIGTAARWHHGPWPQARVAINISSRQLFDNRFAERVHALLQEFNLPARCIEIELTETVLQTGPATIETLKALRSQGIAIALDDFGTGYSSLASLEQLPLTRVKLDRSLIASIDESPRSAAIAQAIISLCGNLGLEITAEGIERAQQLAMLLPHREMCLQGYLISRPVRADDIPSVLAHMSGHMQSILLSTPSLAGDPSPLPVSIPVASDLRSASG